MHRPPYLILAAALVALEALLLLVWAFLVLVNVSTMSVTTAIFFLAYAVALGICAWGLAHCQSWARAPIVLTQLITLGLAWDSRHANSVVAIVLAVVALGSLGCVLHPASMAALAPDDDQS